MAKFNGFGGGGGMGNMQQMLKQAQKLQQQMADAKEEFDSKEFTEVGGGGMVTVTANGAKELSAIKIDPKAVDPDDVEMLEDLIIASINAVFSKIDEENDRIMGPYKGMM